MYSPFLGSCFAELIEEFIFYCCRIRQCWCYPGFWFCSKFSFGCFLREQHLSNNLSILLRKSLHFQRESEEPYSSQYFLYLFQKSLGQNSNIVPNPLFYEDPPILPTSPFFQIFWYPLFKNNPIPPNLPILPLGKIWCPLFSKISKTHPPPRYRGCF